MLQRVCVRKTTAARAGEIRTPLGPEQFVALEMMVRAGANIALRISHADLPGLREIEADSSARSAEHSVLTYLATLEKIVCEQHTTQRRALERAIVTFSGHLRSNVGMRENSVGQRAGGTRRRCAAEVARVRTQQLIGPRQRPRSPPGRKEEEHWILLRNMGAARRVSEPKIGSSKMTRSGAGRIQTSIKGEAVRCEGGLAGQRKTAAT
jgi:hypothetical protein